MSRAQYDRGPIGLGLCALLALSVSGCSSTPAGPASAPEAPRGPAAAQALAAALPGNPGLLAGLMQVQGGRSRRATSRSPDPASNGDNRWLKPGETCVVADLKGPGIIQHIWMTFAEARPGWLGKEGSADPSELVLRMYWDGASQPAVEAPIGDFFAAGFARRAEVRSIPIQVDEGDAYNCFWPMPFFRSARIEVENQSRRPFNAFYYNVDYLEVETLPPGTAYFCAQYRQEFPARLRRDLLVLEAEGRGHYVGTVMSVRARSPEWFGEGDEKIAIDGEEKPSIAGTGTEDYFLEAWGLHKATYPCFGVTVLEGAWGIVGWRMTAYRWHVFDPIRFTRSIRVEFEHYGWMSADETKSGKVEGFVEREDDFATVAFWYQEGQPKRFATLPAAAERKFPDLDLVIEGKTLLAASRTGNGSLGLQKGWDWTGEGQLFYDTDRADGSWFEFSFPVEKEELRQLTVPVTHSYDFGIYQISLDGKKVGGPIDFYRSEVEVEDHSFGQLRLAPGPHTIRFECTGKNAQSRGYKLGVDSVRLRQRWDRKRSPPQ